MTQNIFTVKRKPEYYESVLKRYSITTLKRFVLNEFNPDNKVGLTLNAKDILHHVYSCLAEDIDAMDYDEIVDWCNISFLSKERKIIDHKNPERLMMAVADPGSFSEN